MVENNTRDNSHSKVKNGEVKEKKKKKIGKEAQIEKKKKTIKQPTESSDVVTLESGEGIGSKTAKTKKGKVVAESLKDVVVEPPAAERPTPARKTSKTPKSSSNGGISKPKSGTALKRKKSKKPETTNTDSSQKETGLLFSTKDKESVQLQASPSLQTDGKSAIGSDREEKTKKIPSVTETIISKVEQEKKDDLLLSQAKTEITTKIVKKKKSKVKSVVAADEGNASMQVAKPSKTTKEEGKMERSVHSASTNEAKEKKTKKKSKHHRVDGESRKSVGEVKKRKESQRNDESSGAKVMENSKKGSGHEQKELKSNEKAAKSVGNGNKGKAHIQGTLDSKNNKLNVLTNELDLQASNMLVESGKDDENFVFPQEKSIGNGVYTGSTEKFIGQDALNIARVAEEATEEIKKNLIDKIDIVTKSCEKVEVGATVVQGGTDIIQGKQIDKGSPLTDRKINGTETNIDCQIAKIPANDTAGEPSNTNMSNKTEDQPVSLEDSDTFTAKSSVNVSTTEALNKSDRHVDSPEISSKEDEMKDGGPTRKVSQPIETIEKESTIAAAHSLNNAKEKASYVVVAPVDEDFISETFEDQDRKRDCQIEALPSEESTIEVAQIVDSITMNDIQKATESNSESLSDNKEIVTQEYGSVADSASSKSPGGKVREALSSTQSDVYITDNVKHELERVRQQLISMTQENSELKTSLTQREDELKESQRHIESLENEIEKQLQDWDQVAIKMTDADEKIQTLMKEAQEVESLKAQLLECEGLKSELEEAKLALAELQQKKSPEGDSRTTGELTPTEENNIQLRQVEEDLTPILSNEDSVKLDFASINACLARFSQEICFAKEEIEATQEKIKGM